MQERPMPNHTGPSIGTRIEDFELVDAFGRWVRLSKVAQGRRALILFYRSASW